MKRCNPARVSAAFYPGPGPRRFSVRVSWSTKAARGVSTPDGRLITVRARDRAGPGPPAPERPRGDGRERAADRHPDRGVHRRDDGQVRPARAAAPQGVGKEGEGGDGVEDDHQQLDPQQPAAAAPAALARRAGVRSVELAELDAQLRATRAGVDVALDLRDALARQDALQEAA